MTFTGEYFLDMFKTDFIFLENKDPIPKDAELIKIDINRETNQIIVEYLSRENPEVDEGAVPIDENPTIFKHIWRKR